MRIGLDYRPALLGDSGIPRAVRELARALAAEPRVELRLFGHCLARARRPSCPPEGSTLRRLPIPGRTLSFLARLGLGADRLSGGVDLFHWTDYVHPPVGPRTRVALTLHDCAFAVDPAFHGREQAALLFARTRRAAARADVVICPTRATANDAEQALDIPRERLRVVPFGVDHFRGPPPPPPDLERPYVLCLGTVEPRKNHLRLLEAWRSLGPARPRLLVIGRRGWECDETAAELARACREEAAVWLESADDRTVRACLAAAAALAYPSLHEGFGFPALEALAVGVPVVAGDGAALREVCGDAAFYCDPREPGSIASALRAALWDDEQRAAHRARGLARAARFTWSDAGRRHAAIYREVLS
jgi:glycosyltransferase involved in cell wall biosynthesis